MSTAIRRIATAVLIIAVWAAVVVFGQADGFGQARWVSAVYAFCALVLVGALGTGATIIADACRDRRSE